MLTRLQTLETPGAAAQSAATPASIQDAAPPGETPLFALDFSWVDDAEIHALNRDFRGKDKPTDVLSFSLFESSAEFAGEEFPGAAFPNEGDIALGDLVISLETAARQAGELGHSLEREVAFLTIHGTLHLLGYDHHHSAERRRMWKQQDAIWEEFFPA